MANGSPFASATSDKLGGGCISRRFDSVAESGLGSAKTAVLVPRKVAASGSRFIPFFAFARAVRKIIYTINAIERLHCQVRKTIQNKGHFPSDDAAIELI